MSETARIPHASHPIVYRLLRGIFVIIVRVLYRYRITGLENVPATGACIFTVNHLHLFDPLAVGTGLSRQVVVLVAEKWMDHKFIRLVLRGAGAIYVRRGAVDRQALRDCLEVLNAGGALAIAPEGTRSRTGVLQRGKPGVAYLATRTDAPILPIAVWGVEKLSDWARLKRPTCDVVVGIPFSLPDLDHKPSTDELQDMTDSIMVRIAAMLPPGYRGVYADAVTAAEAGREYVFDDERAGEPA